MYGICYIVSLVHFHVDDDNGDDDEDEMMLLLFPMQFYCYFMSMSSLHPSHIHYDYTTRAQAHERRKKES